MLSLPLRFKGNQLLSSVGEYGGNVAQIPECSTWLRTTFVLIRSHQQVHDASGELPRQHCAALSKVADKYRATVRDISLRGPFVGCRAVQSLTQND